MKSCTLPKDEAPSFGEIFEGFRSANNKHEGGAIVTFTGIVRGDLKGHAAEGIKTSHIEIEAIEGISSEHLERIATEVEARPGINMVTIVHLTGKFELGEPMVHVLVSSAHRDEGFKALEDIVNRYKKETPLWKKEFYSDGSCRWISH